MLQQYVMMTTDDAMESNKKSGRNHDDRPTHNQCIGTWQNDEVVIAGGMSLTIHYFVDKKLF